MTPEDIKRHEIKTIDTIFGQIYKSLKEFHGQYPWEYAQINDEYSMDIRNEIANQYIRLGWNYVYHRTSSESGERYGWTSFMLSMDKLDNTYIQGYHLVTKVVDNVDRKDPKTDYQNKEIECMKKQFNHHDQNKDYMTEISICFDIREIVKLLSCCNQAIVSSEERLRQHGNIQYNGFSLQDSINKIWDIKMKLKNTISNQFGKIHENGIVVTLDIGEFIKLNACCNSAIESEEKMITYIPDTKTFTMCQESIIYIKELKAKIKQSLNAIYGSAFNKQSNIRKGE